jgi:hypothetical protein
MEKIVEYSGFPCPTRSRRARTPRPPRTSRMEKKTGIWNKGSRGTISPATHCGGNPDAVWKSSPALREQSAGSDRHGKTKINLFFAHRHAAPPVRVITFFPRFPILSLPFGTEQRIEYRKLRATVCRKSRYMSSS